MFFLYKKITAKILNVQPRNYKIYQPAYLHISMTTIRISLIFSLFLLYACIRKKEAISYSSPINYDLANPVIINLKPDLDEISGIFYYSKDTSVFAVNDELGVLYKIYIRPKIQVKKWKFSDDGDYEDIVLHDSTFYALQSNGNVKSFTFSSKDSVTAEDCSLPVDGRNEFESLYYDPFQQKIILLCKDCEEDREKIPAYFFDPTDRMFSDAPLYKINPDDIAELLGAEKIKFHPSAAAVNPVTKDLYILSSVNKIMAISSKKGKIKEAYFLDPKLFKQPEGLAFTPAGDMLISNEAAASGAPNILFFKYKPLLHEKN